MEREFLNEQLPEGSLLRGVQAGMRSCADPLSNVPLDRPSLDDTLVAGPPPIAPSPASQSDFPRPSGAVRSTRRRFVGGLARVLRRLASPFLYRFEWRVRTAVGKTGVVDAVTRIEAIAATQREMLRSLADGQAAQDAKLQAELAAFELRLSRWLSTALVNSFTGLETSVTAQQKLLRDVSASQTTAEARLEAQMTLLEERLERRLGEVEDDALARLETVATGQQELLRHLSDTQAIEDAKRQARIAGFEQRLASRLTEVWSDAIARFETVAAGQRDLLQHLSEIQAVEDTKRHARISGFEQRLASRLAEALEETIGRLDAVAAAQRGLLPHLADSESLRDARIEARISDSERRLASRLTEVSSETVARLETVVAAQQDLLPHLSNSQAIEDAKLQAQISGFEQRVVSRLTEVWGGLSTRADRLLGRAILPCGDTFLARTPSGWLLAPASDQKLVSALYECSGVLEPGTTAVVEELLAPGDVVVDAGANIGLIALPAARRVGPLGRVIAVEPTPEIAELLRRTAALNDLAGCLIVHECAAGASPGRQVFNVAQVRGHSSLLPLEEASEPIEVDVRPLDDLVPCGTRVALVKLDVEGFELPVWRGMNRIVAENPDLAVIVEFGPSHLARFGVTIEDWLAELTAPGFTPYEIDEASALCRRLRTEGLDRVASMNLLLLRRPAEQLSRVGFA